MPIAVQIQIDEASLKEAQHILRAVPRGFDRAMKRSTSRTATFARARFARIVAKDLKMNVGDAKKTINVWFVPPFGRKIEISNFSYHLINLDPKQTAEGVSHLTYRGSQKRTTVRHAFIATGAARGRQVWLRARYYIGRPKYIEWKGRIMEAIFALRGGPTPYSVLVGPKNVADYHRICGETEARLVKEINDQISFELRRWAK